MLLNYVQTSSSATDLDPHLSRRQCVSQETLCCVLVECNARQAVWPILEFALGPEKLKSIGGFVHDLGHEQGILAVG